MLFSEDDAGITPAPMVPLSPPNQDNRSDLGLSFPQTAPNDEVGKSPNGIGVIGRIFYVEKGAPAKRAETPKNHGNPL